MNRVITASLSALIIIGAIAGGFFYYQNHKGGAGNAVKAIPADAAFFIQSNSIADLNKLFLTDYWKDISKNKFAADLKNNFKAIVQAADSVETFHELLSKNTLIISAHVTKSGSFDFLFLSGLKSSSDESDANKLISHLSKSGESSTSERKYDGITIYEITLSNNTPFTFAVSKGVFIGSFTSFLVEDAIRQQRFGKSFSGEKEITSAYEKFSTSNQLLLALNYHELPQWLLTFLDPVKSNCRQLEQFASWALLKINLQKDLIMADGEVISSDTTETTYALTGQQPIQNKLIDLLPRKTALACIYSVSDFKTWYSKFNSAQKKEEQYLSRQSLLHHYEMQNRYNFKDRFLQWMGNELALVITEPGSLNYENSVYGIFKANDMEKAKKTLKAFSVILEKKNSGKPNGEAYNKHSINYLDLPGFLPAVFGNAFSKLNKLYYTDIKGYIVFANQASSIRNFIDEVESKNLLGSDELFKSMKFKMLYESNYTLLARIPACDYLFKSAANDAWIKKINDFRFVSEKAEFLSFQLAATTGNPSAKTILQYKASLTEKNTTLLWSAQLDTVVDCIPVTVMDSVNGTKFIAVQDKKNTLYFIDNAGNIKWKKIMEEPILGKIQSVDYFKNGDCQLLFNTVHNLFLVDFEGQNKGNYPIRLPAEATNGVTVIDLDHNLNYKLFVACANKTIYAYEISGKPWTQWSYGESEGTVNHPLQYFKTRTKEIISFTDDIGTIYMLNRYGKPLISLTQKFSLKAGNKLYFKENPDSSITAVTLDNFSGKIIEIKSDGSTSSVEIPSFTNPIAFCYADTKNDGNLRYLVANENTLSSYSNNLEQDFSYSMDDKLEGEIRVLNITGNKKIIGCTSTSNQIYLIKPDGTLLNSQTIKGNKYFILDDLNGDSRLNLISGSTNENVLYVYSIN